MGSSVQSQRLRQIRAKTKKGPCGTLLFLAEGEGFEPSIRFRIHTFQACAFDHSATAPHACLGEAVPLATKSRHRNSGLCMIDWARGKNMLLESNWTALRGKGIPCERCLKSPFSSSKTRGKGLLCEPSPFP